MELTTLFNWIIRSSEMASVLIVIILLIRFVLKDKIGAKWHYALWLLVVLRLVMPINIPSPLSIFNAVDLAQKASFMQTATYVTKPTVVTPVIDNADLEANPENSASQLQVTTGNQLAEEAQATDHPVQALTASEHNPNTIGKQVSSQPITPYKILSLLWLAGVIALALYTLLINVRFYLSVGQEPGLKDHVLNQYLKDCKIRMGVQKDIPIVLTSKVKTPLLLGVFKPKLLFPQKILDGFSEENIRYVIMHELSHYQRKDIVVNWLLVGVQVLHWFNPIIWYAFSRMREDCEVATDAKALTYLEPEEREQYGFTLINLVAYLSKPQWLPATTGFLGGKGQLKRRITMIKLFKKSSYKWSLLALVIIVAVGILGLTSAAKGNKVASKPDTQSPEQGIDMHQAASVHFKSIEMVTDKIGWAASQDGKVLRTEDGGVTWADVTPVDLPKAEPATTPTLAFFRQQDAQDAWLLDLRDETVYRTTDGGQHWQKGTPPNLAMANDGGSFLSFSSPEEGWLLVSSGAHNQVGQLFKTKDGGMNWVGVAQTGSQGNLPFGGQITFSPTVKGLGWLRSDRQVGAKGIPPLYVTHDGGKTWQPQQLTFATQDQDYASDQVYVQLPQFNGGADGLMPVTLMSGKHNLGSFFTTSDGGQTWKLAERLDNVGSSEALITSMVDTQTFWCYVPDGNTLYTASTPQVVWHSTQPQPSLYAFQAQYSPFPQLDFSSAQEGWAVLDGQLLHSKDGGKTWTIVGTPKSKQTTIKPTDLTDVNFQDAQHGWGINGRGVQSRVIRTENGGTNWLDVTPAQAQIDSAAMGWNGYFLNPQTAWAALSLPPNGQGSTAIYRTTDGGKTWRSTVVPYTGMVQMSFRDEKHGWMMLHQDAAAGSEGVTLLATNDGGATWQHLANIGPDSPAFGGGKSGLGFADAQRGWMTGNWAGDSVLLYQTTDGGKTWAHQQLATPSGLNADGGAAISYAPIFSTPQDGVLPVVFNSSQALVLYQSHDAGRTWSPTTTLRFKDKYPQANFSIIDPQHVVVTADQSYTYTTSDGGRHWQAVQSSSSLKYVEKINFANLSDGWALLPSNNNGTNHTTLLARTTDGGQRWTGLPQSAGSSSNITGVGDMVGTPITQKYMLNAQTGWTFELHPNKAMIVYGTQDGGLSWTQLDKVPVKYGDGNMSVTFADAQHGWFEVRTAGMGQLSGELFATTNGGKTWQRVADSAQKGSVPFGGGLTAQKDGTLWLNGAQRAAGSLGGPGFIWLYKSTDGGKNWTQVQLPLTAAHQQESTTVSPPVFSGQEGSVTVLFQGGDKVVYDSHDGGRTWSASSSRD